MPWMTLPDPGPRSIPRPAFEEQRAWRRRYLAICAAVLAAVMVALALLLLFGGLGLSVNGSIALFLGVTLTVGLAMALMGLVFHSARSGSDRDAHERERRP